jgi:molybdopterin synthase sulfur carrier subunit
MTTATSPEFRVRVLLFGSYAEMLGLDSLELRLEHPATVRQAVEHLRDLPGGKRLPTKPLCAVNLTHVTQEALLSAGDELAILPPLAGG